MSKSLLLILTFWLVDADPRVIFLSEIYNDWTIYEVEDGAYLYLASNDNNDYLRNITITSGNTSITLDQINLVDLDGPPPYFVLNDGLTILTSNNDSVIDDLNGFIYITTKEQADDPTFSVYVIKKSHRITTTPPKSTVVVLNTQLSQPKENLDTPDMNSYITGFYQCPDTNLTFNWGIPDADWLNSTKKEFFRNPLYLNISDENGNYSNTKKIFFDTIDSLQVPLQVWWLTVEGLMTMNISNYYEANYNYTTKNVNTTGLIISEDYFNSHEVNFKSDSSSSTTVGTFITTFLFPNQTVSFTLSDLNGESVVQSYTDKDNEAFQALEFTEMQASKLFVNSPDTMPGLFFCQYFVFSGDLLSTSTTTTTSTTTSTVTSTTTTKAVPPVTSTSTTQAPIGSSSPSSISTGTSSSSPSTAPITTIETTTKSIESPSILSSILFIIFSFFFLF